MISEISAELGNSCERAELWGFEVERRACIAELKRRLGCRKEGGELVRMLGGGDLISDMSTELMEFYKSAELMVLIIGGELF